MTPTWITLHDGSSMMKKAKSERKNRSVTCRRIAGPDIPGMMVKEGRPVLPMWSSRVHLSHVFLNGAFAVSNT